MDFVVKQISSRDTKMIQTVGESLLFLKQEYPNFSDWYNRAIKSSNNGKEHREIYVASPVGQEDLISGIMILKDSPMQKKICTLCVMEPYRHMGIGTSFVDLACKRLGTQAPLITVSQTHKTEFEQLFQKFGFRLFKTYPGYYRRDLTEYSYNAEIEPCVLKLAANE